MFTGCNRSFESRQAFLEHVNEKHPNKKLECPYDICIEIFFTQDDLRAHILKHQTGKWDPVKKK